MDIPRITKITINMGVGAASADKKLLDGALSDMLAITWSKTSISLARKSSLVSKSVMVGRSAVKLLYAANVCTNSLDRFISIAIPRIRDFRGFSAKSFDGRG